MGIDRPVPLAPGHVLDRFFSGEPAVDDWLVKHARRNEQSGGSRTFVVCEGEERVVGFYALSASSVARKGARGRYARNMPDPIPVVRLGQLGVDRIYQGMGLAKALVKDAAIRTLAASRNAGVAALVVDALVEELMPFYQHLGFEAVRDDSPNLLAVRVKDLRALLTA